MAYLEEDLLALSGIQHFAFCPRQWALIHLEQQWQENLRTAEGRIMHERVHDASLQDSRDGVVTLRGVTLVSYRLGLQGIADVVEFLPIHDDVAGMQLPGYRGRYLPRPVEYKRGKPKRDDRDKVQLCAQALCMEEMYGLTVADGSLFYGQTRRRVDVPFTEQLRKRVADLAGRMHEAYALEITPKAKNQVNCDLCSMVDVCLPDVTRKSRSVSDYMLERINRLLADSGDML